MNNIVKSAQPVATRPMSLRRFMPNLLNDFFDDFSMPSLYMRPLMSETYEPQIRVNVSEKPKEFVVKAEIPGAKKEDIHVNIDGSFVNISAQMQTQYEEKGGGERVIRSECYFGSASRGFQLPSEVSREKAQASYENGVLKLTLPKINGGSSNEIQIK